MAFSTAQPDDHFYLLPTDNHKHVTLNQPLIIVNSIQAQTQQTNTIQAI